MKKLFSAHLSAGLLTTAVACLVFSQQPAANKWVIGFGFAFIGLTDGIARRNMASCVAGFCVSYFLSSFVASLLVSSMNYPDYGLFGIGWFDFQWQGSGYVLAGYAAILGASLPMFFAKPSAAILTMISGTFAILVVAMMGEFLAHQFPSIDMFYELSLWEYLTVLCAVPISALMVWLPANWVFAEGSLWQK